MVRAVVDSCSLVARHRDRQRGLRNAQHARDDGNIVVAGMGSLFKSVCERVRHAARIDDAREIGIDGSLAVGEALAGHRHALCRKRFAVVRLARIVRRQHHRPLVNRHGCRALDGRVVRVRGLEAHDGGTLRRVEERRRLFEVERPRVRVEVPDLGAFDRGRRLDAHPLAVVPLRNVVGGHRHDPCRVDGKVAVRHRQRHVVVPRRNVEAVGREPHRVGSRVGALGVGEHAVFELDGGPAGSIVGKTVDLVRPTVERHRVVVAHHVYRQGGLAHRQGSLVLGYRVVALAHALGESIGEGVGRRSRIGLRAGYGERGLLAVHEAKAAHGYGRVRQRVAIVDFLAIGARHRDGAHRYLNGGLAVGVLMVRERRLEFHRLGPVGHVEVRRARIERVVAALGGPVADLRAGEGCGRLDAMALPVVHGTHGLGRHRQGTGGAYGKLPVGHFQRHLVVARRHREAFRGEAHGVLAHVHAFGMGGDVSGKLDRGLASNVVEHLVAVDRLERAVVGDRFHSALDADGQRGLLHLERAGDFPHLVVRCLRSLVQAVVEGIGRRTRIGQRREVGIRSALAGHEAAGHDDVLGDQRRPVVRFGRVGAGQRDGTRVDGDGRRALGGVVVVKGSLEFHGIGSRVRVFRRFRQVVRIRFRVVVPDLGPVDRGLGLHTVARPIVGFDDRLGIDAQRARLVDVQVAVDHVQRHAVVIGLHRELLRGQVHGIPACRHALGIRPLAVFQRDGRLPGGLVAHLEALHRMGLPVERHVVERARHRYQQGSRRDGQGAEQRGYLVVVRVHAFGELVGEPVVAVVRVGDVGRGAVIGDFGLLAADERPVDNACLVLDERRSVVFPLGIAGAQNHRALVDGNGCGSIRRLVVRMGRLELHRLRAVRPIEERRGFFQGVLSRSRIAVADRRALHRSLGLHAVAVAVIGLSHVAGRNGHLPRRVDAQVAVDHVQRHRVVRRGDVEAVGREAHEVLARIRALGMGGRTLLESDRHLVCGIVDEAADLMHAPIVGNRCMVAHHRYQQRRRRDGQGAEQRGHFVVVRVHALGERISELVVFVTRVGDVRRGTGHLVRRLLAGNEPVTAHLHRGGYKRFAVVLPGSACALQRHRALLDGDGCGAFGNVAVVRVGCLESHGMRAGILEHRRLIKIECVGGLVVVLDRRAAILD